MSRLITYAPEHIGTITRPTPDERRQENDRWVSLRTLESKPSAIDETPACADVSHARRPSSILRDIDRRHAEARRKTQG